MSDPILLYSTNTWIAYTIGQKFYRQCHYVWCTPHSQPASQSTLDTTVPPSSNPLEIYWNLYREVKAGDRHSTKIEQNRAGILRGAELKKRAGVISDTEEADIASALQLAEARDFRPLLYVIPYTLVNDIVRPVPVQERAHPLSSEFIIESLPRDSFDVLEFEP